MSNQINNTIRCHITVPHTCSYLPGHQAINLVVDPGLEINDIWLEELMEHGFRRSGGHIYRPHCQNCNACVSVKIYARSFKSNRSQRRNWRKNSVLTHAAMPPVFNSEHFDLYCKYIANRHSDGDMSNPTPTDYINFLAAKNISTVFHEFRLQEKLLAVTVTDHTTNGLSAVYTFFDPDFGHLGLGTYAILWLIRHARIHDLAWVYLGYWVRDCDKMSYKSHFTPQLGYVDGKWQRMVP